MKDTIEEISEELWAQIMEAFEIKLAEFGVPYDREAVVKAEVANNIVTKLENNLIVEG
jgi:hypothetical protein